MVIDDATFDRVHANSNFRSMPKGTLKMFVGTLQNQRIQDSRWRHMSWLVEQEADPDAEQPWTTWRDKLLAATGWSSVGVAAAFSGGGKQQSGEERMTAKAFQSRYAQSGCMALDLSFTPPAQLPPTKCDICGEACSSECVCGEAYCSKRCQREAWISKHKHRRLCEVVVENNEMGVAFTQAEMKLALTKDEWRVAMGQEALVKQERAATAKAAKPRPPLPDDTRTRAPSMSSGAGAPDSNPACCFGVC